MAVNEKTAKSRNNNLIFLLLMRRIKESFIDSSSGFLEDDILSV